MSSFGGVIGAGFGFGSSLVGTYEQNRAIKSAGAADVAGVELQYGQIDQATELEIKKRKIEAQGVRSRLRVLAGDSGFDMGGGSFRALQDQSLREEDINRSIVQLNAHNQKVNLQSQLKANLIRLFSGTKNPLVAGVTGGLEGYGSGSRIGSLFEPKAGAASDMGPSAELGGYGDYAGYAGEIDPGIAGLATQGGYA